MRKRFQNGSIKEVNGAYVAQWWEDGHRRNKTLGRISTKFTKSKARAELAAILRPINARSRTPSVLCTFREFVQDVYLPFYRRKWKESSTAPSNEDRVRRHLIPEFGTRTLGSFDRNGLQDFLDRKAAAGLSFSVVSHLRFDLRQVFRLAVADGYISVTPLHMDLTDYSYRKKMAGWLPTTLK
jgi:hypothetical protein